MLRTALVAIVSWVVLVACGSPFVEGWRDDDDEQKISKEEVCSRKKDKVWVEGECRDKSELNLTDLGEGECRESGLGGWVDGRCVPFKDMTEEQCGQVEGRVYYAGQCLSREQYACERDPKTIFVEGSCLLRPQLTLTGDPERRVYAGFPIEPWALQATDAARIALENATCENFFVLEKGKLTAPDTFVEPGKCSVDLVGRLGKAVSQRVRVEVEIVPSFYSYCEDQDLDPEASYTVYVIESQLQKPTCADNLKALQEVGSIDLRNVTPPVMSLAPLVGLTKVHHLLIAYFETPTSEYGGKVQDLSPLASLTSLQFLDLTRNPVKDLSPLAGLRSLRALHLEGTPLDLDPALKTEASCPTGKDVPPALRKFCEQ